MKIYFAAIEYTDDCQKLSMSMEKSLARGDFQKLIDTAEKIKSLSDKQHSLELKVKTWEKMLAAIRHFIPDFSADYVISASSVNTIAQLQLDVSEDIKQILAYSSKNGLEVIQLPEEN